MNPTVRNWAGLPLLMLSLCSGSCGSEAELVSPGHQPETTPQQAAPALALDDPRRPQGWTDEQWLHYGPDHLQQNYGGGL